MTANSPYLNDGIAINHKPQEHHVHRICQEINVKRNQKNPCSPVNEPLTLFLCCKNFLAQACSLLHFTLVNFFLFYSIFFFKGAKSTLAAYCKQLKYRHRLLSVKTNHFCCKKPRCSRAESLSQGNYI